MKILLIAGHGQGDSGACNGNFREADLAREVVNALAKKLSQIMDVTVFPLEKNMFTCLSSGQYNFKPYDYVLEIHFNAAAKDTIGDGKTTGVEMLIHTSEAGMSVEEKIVKRLAALGFTNRGVKRRQNLKNMNVCKRDQGVSYGLLELCFIDDADDMRLYQAKKEEIISAVCKGLAEGFDIEYSEKENMPLASANDIAWELNHAYFPITEMKNFVTALEIARQSGSPLYWGFYKLVNKIK